MTFAWYGHLKFQEWELDEKICALVGYSHQLGIALFEYIFQVPANRIGFRENGGRLLPCFS
ncbi:MAG: DMT family protein [Cloacibacterium normanense]